MNTNKFTNTLQVDLTGQAPHMVCEGQRIASIKAENRDQVREHRITGEFRWEGTSEHLWSKPLLKAGQTRLLQLDLENLQGWRLHGCPGQPVPLPDCPYRETISPCILSEPVFSIGSQTLLYDHGFSSFHSPTL